MTQAQEQATTDPGTDRLTERLWAAPTPARRGPRPTLTIDRIVEAAFELADAEGLAAVTMARLGAALGVTPMALYRHVSNKDELLALLADGIAPELPEPPPGTAWRTALELWTQTQVDLAVRRPWMLDLPLSTVTPGPRRLRWIEQAFVILAGLPLTVGEKFAIVGLLGQHVLGEARVQVEQRRAANPEINPLAEIAAPLRTYAAKDEYPHLLAAISAWDEEPPLTEHTPDDPGVDDDAFGLRILLDGVEQYVARLTTARSGNTRA